MEFLIEKIAAVRGGKMTYLSVNGKTYKWGDSEKASSFNLDDVFPALRMAKLKSKHPNRIAITFSKHVR